MSQVSLLLSQTKDAYDWVNKLIEPIPERKWDEIPEGIDSSVTWQVGHLLVSLYFHSIMSIKGHQMDILQQVPMKDYSRWFTKAAPHSSVGKTDSDHLKRHLELVQHKSLEIIAGLRREHLDDPLEPLQTPNPMAKVKFEAIDWNIKHTMWHCGQLAILRRHWVGRVDFGL